MPCAHDHGPHRLDKQFAVEPEGPVIYIFKIKFHPFFKVEAVAATYLPDTGDAGFHGEAAALAGHVFSHFGGQRRAGANEAHLALQHVEELRQFIEAGFAQKPAEGSDARVVFDLECRAVHFIGRLELGFEVFGILNHGAELVDLEFPAIDPATCLFEKNRPLGAGLYGKAYDEEKRGKNDQSDQGEREIHKPFDQKAEILWRR